MRAGVRELVRADHVFLTRRLLLEPWSEPHRAPFRAVCGDPRVMQFIGGGHPWSDAKADEVFDAALAHWREHGFGWRSILETETREWVGLLGLNVLGEGIEAVSPDEVEIGWWLRPDSWGLGYALEAATTVRDDAFTRLDLPRLVARINPANTASAQLAQRIGMVFWRRSRGPQGPLDIFRLAPGGRRERGEVPQM
jgi:RimJ/RimL family protein N-acetyltransferase